MVDGTVLSPGESQEPLGFTGPAANLRATYFHTPESRTEFFTSTLWLDGVTRNHAVYVWAKFEREGNSEGTLAVIESIDPPVLKAIDNDGNPYAVNIRSVVALAYQVEGPDAPWPLVLMNNYHRIPYRSTNPAESLFGFDFLTGKSNLLDFGTAFLRRYLDLHEYLITSRIEQDREQHIQRLTDDITTSIKTYLLHRQLTISSAQTDQQIYLKYRQTAPEKSAALIAVSRRLLKVQNEFDEYRAKSAHLGHILETTDNVIQHLRVHLSTLYPYRRIHIIPRLILEDALPRHSGHLGDRIRELSMQHEGLRIQKETLEAKISRLRHTVGELNHNRDLLIQETSEARDLQLVRIVNQLQLCLSQLRLREAEHKTIESKLIALTELGVSPESIGLHRQFEDPEQVQMLRDLRSFLEHALYTLGRTHGG